MSSRVTVALLLMVSLQRGGGGGGGDMGGAPMASDPTPFEQFVSKLKIDEKKQLPQVVQSLMRGALSGKEWDTAPDLRFY